MLPLLLPSLLLLLLSTVAAAPTHHHYRPLWPQEPWPTRADVDAAVARVSRALTHETVSAPPSDSGGGGAPAPQMRALHGFIERSYPAIFAGSARSSSWWWPKATAAAATTKNSTSLRGDGGSPPPDAAAVTVSRLGCGGLSLLIAVRGRDPSLRPVLLVSHLDVVAAPQDAAQGSKNRWTHPPFSGAVAEGSVWGRGAIDVKGPALALLEALSSLLQSPWRPLRTVLVALGHDEEVGGACGAQRIAAHLQATLGGGAGGGAAAASASPSSSSSSSPPARPILHALWDEGPGVMLDGVPPLVSRPTALIGTAEKRAVRVVVRARAAGGHASMPPIASSGDAKAAAEKEKEERTDVGFSVGAALGRVLAAVDADPPKAELRPPTSDMLLAVAPHADNPRMRALLPIAVRLPFLRPLVARALCRASAAGAALVRTTVVATRLSAGAAAGENVMPQHGEAVFNVRLLPGFGGFKALRAYFEGRVEAALGRRGAAGVEVVVGGGGYGEGGGEGEEGAVAPSDGDAFGAVRGAIERCWRFAESSSSSSSSSAPPLVAPTLLTGMTDSRNYAHLVATGGGGGRGGGKGGGGKGGGGGGVLRFLPVGLSRASLARIHGTDERLDVSDLARAMCTYRVGIEALGDLPEGEAEGGGGGGEAGEARGAEL